MTTLPAIRKRKLNAEELGTEYLAARGHVMKMEEEMLRADKIRTEPSSPPTPTESPPPPPLTRQPSNDGVDASVLVELLVRMTHLSDLKPLLEAAARGEVSLRELRLRLTEIFIFRPSAPGSLQFVWDQARATTTERRSRAQKELEEAVDRESRGLWDNCWSHRQDTLLVAWVHAPGRVAWAVARPPARPPRPA